jgi:ABC-type polysaccharide/polyol phosphate transport system ATPase subunit
MARISLHNVVIDFPVINAASHSLQLRIFKALGGQLTSHQNTVVVRALDGVNLELRDGDRLGLIGHNGSGKTTLLRVLAGVYTPSIGEVSMDGSISSLTDLALGMDQESTGWENIEFRCAFLGMTFREAKRLSSAIAEFSELGEYLDLPTRTYSSGMFMRLAFSISTSIDPEILIIDEVVGAGDTYFVEKAKRRLKQVVDKANILALASHDLVMLADVCNKVVWMEHGKIRQLGPPADILPAYRTAMAA